MKGEILIIIPARGGSKGIPGKNLRLINDKPMIYYAITTAKKIPHSKVIVSTEDPLIKEVAKIYGAEVLLRPEELARDNVTLEPVIIDVISKINFGDIIITLQPTSPLLKATTLEKALNYFLQEKFDTLVSVRKKTHLFWIEANGKFFPFYKERANRQFLKPVYEETGGLVITYRDVILKNRSRFGVKIGIYSLNEDESLDIDSWEQLIIAELIMKRLKIAIRTEGSHEMGLGHIYRALTIANLFPEHEVIFLTNPEKKPGYMKLKEHTFPIELYRSEDELLKKIDQISPDILINDILDTGEKYIDKLKQKGIFVVNFEDVGSGSRKADLLINALYEWSGREENAFFGYRYECLREEFYMFPIKDSIREKVENILITFGGTDPSNLTKRVIKILPDILPEDVRVTVITGLGYKHTDELKNLIVNLSEKGYQIEMISGSPIMAKYMFEADLIITSNGRTVYEAVSSATPTLVIAQNPREMTHTFAKICRGIKFLGLASELKDNEIMQVVRELLTDYNKRKQMNTLLIPYAREIRKGRERIKKLIIEKFEEWKDATGAKNKNW